MVWEAVSPLGLTAFVSNAQAKQIAEEAGKRAGVAMRRRRRTFLRRLFLPLVKLQGA
jgi:hypothetical protein